MILLQQSSTAPSISEKSKGKMRAVQVEEANSSSDAGSDTATLETPTVKDFPLPEEPEVSL